MLKQSMHSFVLLYPNVLLEGWNVEKVSERYEGEKWGTFWFQVVTPTGMFRVKEFFLDIIEPVFPDSCISQAKGDCFQYKGLVYWKGVNYKGKESYVTSIWKTQVEISVDHGYVNHPSCIGTLTSFRIFLIISKLATPFIVPSRSITWMFLAPKSSQCLATSSGFSISTISLPGSP